MTITESEFRRRLALVMNASASSVASFAELGPAVSAVLAEARAAGLELAPAFSTPRAIGTSKDGLYLGDQDPDDKRSYGSCGNFWARLETESYYDTIPMEDRKAIAREAVRRYNVHPALEARAARLAAALGELLDTVDATEAEGWMPMRLRQALAEGRAALAEGGEP